MDDRKLFRIGDVARMFHLSVGTLRHYEQAGLLAPEYTDEQTGYRYYSVRQFEVLTNICYLRALDMPLPEIADFLHNRDVAVIEEKLRMQKAIIAQKKRDLETIERKIDHRIRQIEDARTSQLDRIQLLPMPACRIVWIRDPLQWKSYLSLEHSIRRLEAHQKIPITFQGKVGVGVSKENLAAGQYARYDLVFLILDDEDCYEGRVEEQPAGLYMTVRFHGSHGEAPGYYEKLLREIEAQGREVVGFSRELTLIDNAIANDPEKFVTEIRIPVR